MKKKRERQDGNTKSHEKKEKQASFAIKELRLNCLRKMRMRDKQLTKKCKHSVNTSKH